MSIPSSHGSFRKSLSFFKDKDLEGFDRAVLEGRPLKQGFLIKHKCIRGDWEKGSVTNNWRKRWFQLINNCMVYFKLPSDTKPKGFFELEGGSVEMCEERTGRKFCFVVHTKMNTHFLLVASTSDILNNWLSVIKQVTEPAMEPPTPRIGAGPPPLLKHTSSLDVLGREKPPPITVSMKRVRFKTEIQGEKPNPRHRHCSFMIDGVRMLVFGGGDGEGQAFGDVNVFNLGSATWDPYNITGVPPSPREGHSATCHRELVYVFGGLRGEEVAGDLLTLNMDELVWDTVQTSGDQPPPRHGHVAGIIDDMLYVFGGKAGDGSILTDLYVLDLHNKKWVAVEVTCDDLEPHFDMMGATFDDSMTMFGGSTAKGLSNKVYSFDARAQKWVTEQPKGAPPAPRRHAASAPFKNRLLFLLGGETAEGIQSDIWALDFVGYTWMKISLSGNPLEAMSGMSLCVKDQVVYIFGGKNSAGMTNNVAVVKVMDKGLPSINLRSAARPSIVQRMQLKDPCLQDFEIGVTLGTGSFGRVSCVKHKRTGKFYALKVLKKKEIIQLNQVDHINAEREVLSSISHPHIVNFCGSFQDSKKLYIVMEFVSGGEFFTHLRKAGRFKEDVARFYAAQILSGLDYLHSNNIVYRDLKPENILLDSRGHAKITDFGFAKQVDFRTWTLCGTPEYLAPEIILSKGHAKPADYWALGILAFEMLAGYPPFYDDEPLRIYQKILQGEIKWPYHFSADSKDFIASLLVADVNKRLGSGKKGTEALKEHAWFRTIDWQDISGTSLPAPIQPTVKSDGDTSQFERYPEEQEENWPDCTEAENAKFANFG